MRRILSLWFPQFPIERMQASRRKAGQPPLAAPGQPFALIASGKRGLSLASIDKAAAARGLSPGMRLTDARAIAPDLATAVAEPEADAAALLALARWAERYSPWVAPDGSDGLLIDISGIGHLFGGDGRLVADLCQRLDKFGFTSRTGLAATIGAAHAFARYGGTALASLPIAALRLEPEMAATLARLGLTTIASLEAIPRASLARRFRDKDRLARLLTRLDQALGREDEPLTPLTPPPVFAVRHATAEPLISHEGVMHVVMQLIGRLCRKLDRAGQGALRLDLTLYRSDGSWSALPIGFSRPARDGLHIARLLAPKLETLDAGYGIDALALAAAETAPVTAEAGSFLAQQEDAKPLAELADRIANRPDPARIAHLMPQESHVPEMAERHAAAAAISAAAPETPPPTGPRPVTLFRHPEPVTVMAAVPDGPPLRFTWRRMAHRILRAEGPERIAPEWWRTPQAAAAAAATQPARPRDYYAVEDDKGRRFWIFREGFYGEPDGNEPQWFVHGLFP